MKFECGLVLSLAFLLGYGLTASIVKFESDSKRDIQVKFKADSKQDIQLEELNSIMKKLGIKLEKPRTQWRIPKKLLMHPTECEKLTYCQSDSAPEAGMFKRHPFFPWWYYSCQHGTVKCHSCHRNTENSDVITYFYSERYQKCIS